MCREDCVDVCMGRSFHLHRVSVTKAIYAFVYFWSGYLFIATAHTKPRTLRLVDRGQHKRRYCRALALSELDILCFTWKTARLLWLAVKHLTPPASTI